MSDQVYMYLIDHAAPIITAIGVIVIAYLQYKLRLIGKERLKQNGASPETLRKL